MSNVAGRLYIVATPIGNLDDITRRAVQVLNDVDGIVAEDTRHSRHLLDHLGIRRPMASLHEHNEPEAVRRVVARLQRGESLALISDAGTPLISDPGFPLVRECRALGIAVMAVPGPSAVVAALSVSGLATDRFRFEGFPPRRQAARLSHLSSLRGETATLVFYESAHRVLETLCDMVTAFGGDRFAVMARELTKVHETVLASPLADLSARVAEDADQRKGEFVLMVAGASPKQADQAGQDELLRVLLDELPVKQAAGLAARISGAKRNLMYRRALELVDGGDA